MEIIGKTGLTSARKPTVLSYIRHDNLHTAQSLLNSGTSARILLPIPDADYLDTPSVSVIRRLLEKLERHSSEGIRQGEDQCLVEQRA